jgi:signal transduction histidine kinase
MKRYASIRSTRLIITVTLLILIYIAYLFYIRLQSLIEYSNLVDETNQLKFKTEECFSILKDAETGQCGYLLTKDSLFLQPLDSANKNIYAALDELIDLASMDSDYTNLINSLKTTIYRRMDHLNMVVANDRSYKDYTGINVNVLLKGKLAMDDIRKTLNQLHQTIDIKLSAQQTIKNRYASITPLFMVVLSLLSIVLVYIAYLIIMRELRARILVQDDLQYNINALQRSNAELEQFAYVASHDLQEPLRKIQTFSNRLLVKHKQHLDEDGKFIVDRMQHAAERMRILINDLLSYSQIVNSNERRFETTDLNVSLKNVLDVLSDRITSVNAKISFEKLPLIKANSTQIEQLLMNLLSNALKFISPDKRPQIEIRYSSVEGQQIQNVKPADAHRFFHKISIKDNGIGFDEQYAEKIFVIFQRLQGKSEYTGTGIGLAMCKRIVENHDGYIIAKSRMQKGSEFMIFLPMPDQ